MALLAEGVTISEAARRIDANRSTIRRWAAGGVPRSHPASPLFDPAPIGVLPAIAYCYLLGLYLGEGHLVRAGRSWMLRRLLRLAPLAGGLATTRRREKARPPDRVGRVAACVDVQSAPGVDPRADPLRWLPLHRKPARRPTDVPVRAVCVRESFGRHPQDLLRAPGPHRGWLVTTPPGHGRDRSPRRRCGARPLRRAETLIRRTKPRSPWRARARQCERSLRLTAAD